MGLLISKYLPIFTNAIKHRHVQIRYYKSFAGYGLVALDVNGGGFAIILGGIRDIVLYGSQRATTQLRMKSLSRLSAFAFSNRSG